ncbi:hypothetical protein SCLCIDRAFT_1208690 [Scleroderma citrinum Foug A]|uniref:Uncharacterized protein n=1 Tax=Scleroderma citrinum Foug A TaxID=1036808 RepID=A0A0C3AWC3_9AGAM|nr:hypothetical protein SCLCIDRAFT_1208690 [Scleroderma citrinum Foug A]
MSAPLLPSSVAHAMYPHKRDRARQRTTILALFALVAFSCYILFITNPSLSARSRVYGDRGALAYKDFVAMPHASSPTRRPQPIYRPVHTHSPQLVLTPSQELAALSAFLAALPHNRLPSAVNPNQPLDPQLILDFNTDSESAREELDRVVEEMWTRHPVVLFARRHSMHSRELQGTLTRMNLNPSPLVFEVDQRDDASVLTPLLTRLTGVPTLPILLIGGKPIGVGARNLESLMAEIQGLEDSGELKSMILGAGAGINPTTKSRKGK